MATCPECDFTYGAWPREALAPTMADLGRRTAARLTAGAAPLHQRRVADEWSVVEYGCHVRDVVLVQRDRLFVALVEDEPSFKPMYRDHRVAFDRYDQQDPDDVARQLTMAAAMAGQAFAGVTGAQWSRTLIYNFPEPQVHDIEWMAHHTVHEMVHHLRDIDGLLASP